MRLGLPKAGYECVHVGRYKIRASQELSASHRVSTGLSKCPHINDKQAQETCGTQVEMRAIVLWWAPRASHMQSSYTPLLSVARNRGDNIDKISTPIHLSTQVAASINRIYSQLYRLHRSCNSFSPGIHIKRYTPRTTKNPMAASQEPANSELS